METALKISYSHDCLKQLCMSRKEDVVLWGYIEGNEGKAWVDNLLEPRQALLIVADFCYLIGTPDNPNEIKNILLNYSKHKVIIVDNSSWANFFEDYLPNKYKKYERYSIKREPNIFSRDILNQYITCLDTGYILKKIDQDIYYEVLKIDWAADGCCYFRSVQDFLEHGLGYVVLSDNQIVSIASSYTYCEDNIEITIGTAEEHRRNGLALACASKLILDCLEKGIYPRWEAVSMESVALAEKLGYHFEEAFEVYSICD